MANISKIQLPGSGGVYDIKDAVAIHEADLMSETKLVNAAADGTEISGRVYPVRYDKNGKLAVNVPWAGGDPSAISNAEIDALFPHPSTAIEKITTSQIDALF